MTPAEQFFAEHGTDIVAYDGQTGLFTYRENPPSFLFSSERIRKIWLTQFAGKCAGGRTGGGYLCLRFARRTVRAHGYALFLHLGRWPVIVDHINGDPSDNRILNLREADESINRRNQRLRSDNTSGHPGIVYHSASRRWVAQICVRGRRKHLGTFHTKEAAVAARMKAQQEMGFGPNHGAPRGGRSFSTASPAAFGGIG